MSRVIKAFKNYAPKKVKKPTAFFKCGAAESIIIIILVLWTQQPHNNTVKLSWLWLGVYGEVHMFYDASIFIQPYACELHFDENLRRSERKRRRNPNIIFYLINVIFFY